MMKNNFSCFMLAGLFCCGAVYAQGTVDYYNPNTNRYDYHRLQKETRRVTLNSDEFAIYEKFLNKFNPNINITDSECSLQAKKKNADVDPYYFIEFSGCKTIDDGEQVSLYGWSETMKSAGIDGKNCTIQYSKKLVQDAKRSDNSWNKTFCDQDKCHKFSTVHLSFDYKSCENHQEQYPKAVYGKVDVIFSKYNVDSEDTPYLGGPARGPVTTKRYSMNIE